MRLVVARCEVRYSGRLKAYLPEAVRLVMIKADGTVMVWSDHDGYKVKPLNWMTPPTAIEESEGLIVVRKRAGKTEDRLEIHLHEVLSDVEHDMGEAAALEKDGVERDLQLELAAQPEALGEELRLVRREWQTDLGPVDLMCRDEDDGWVAVEIKRVATIDAVETTVALPRTDPPRPGEGGLSRHPRRAADHEAGPHAGGVPRLALRRPWGNRAADRRAGPRHPPARPRG